VWAQRSFVGPWESARGKTAELHRSRSEGVRVAFILCGGSKGTAEDPGFPRERFPYSLGRG